MTLIATHEPDAQTTETGTCIICGAPVLRAHYTHLDGDTDICPLTGFAACLERAARAARDRREAALAQARQEATTDPAAGTEDTGGQEDAPDSPVPAADPDTAPGGVVPPVSPGAVPAGAEVA